MMWVFSCWRGIKGSASFCPGGLGLWFSAFQIVKIDRDFNPQTTDIVLGQERQKKLAERKKAQDAWILFLKMVGYP